MKDIRATDPTGKRPEIKLAEQNLNEAFKKVVDS